MTHEEIKNLINTNLADEPMIVPEKHREVEHALLNASQKVTARIENIYGTARIEIEIPEGTTLDDDDFQDITLRVVLISKVTTYDTNAKDLVVVKEIENQDIRGGYKIVIPLQKAECEHLHIVSIDAVVSNKTIYKIK